MAQSCGDTRSTPATKTEQSPLQSDYPKPPKRMPSDESNISTANVYGQYGNAPWEVNRDPYEYLKLLPNALPLHLLGQLLSSPNQHHLRIYSSLCVC